MSDLSLLSNSAYAVSNISNLILATPEVTGIQPQQGDSLGESFIFDYEGENSVTLESDITDHYAEDNKSLQDQIALRPVVINTTGFIGELNNVPPAALKAIDEKVDKLQAIGGFAPELTVAAQRAYDLAFQAYQASQVISNFASQKFEGATKQTKQQEAFTKFKIWMDNRQLFTVQTPWGTFVNCAIEKMVAVQDDDTLEFSTFEISFKAMRFSSEINEEEPNVVSGRLNQQSQEGAGVDKGLTNPAAVPYSVDSMFPTSIA